MHNLKNNFKEDKKQLRILILVAFSLIMNSRANTTLIETASNSVSIVLVIFIVDSKVFSCIVLLMIYCLLVKLKKYFFVISN